MQYEVLLVDESLAEIDDTAIDGLLNRAGLAMPIYVNLGIHRTERIVREVQAGLVRKQAEHIVAKLSAQRLLRSGCAATLPASSWPANWLCGTPPSLHLTGRPHQFRP